MAILVFCSACQFALEVDGKQVEELFGTQIMAGVQARSVNAQGQIFGHLAAFHGIDADLLQLLAEID